MSEELIQRNLVEAPEKMGDWNFYNIGATTLKALKGAKIIPDRDYDEYEKKKPDVLIVKKPLVIAAIEYKQPKELRTDKQVAAAIAQELGTAPSFASKNLYCYRWKEICQGCFLHIQLNKTNCILTEQVAASKSRHSIK